MLAISFESSELSVEDRGELLRAGLQWHNLNILILQSGKARHLMCIRFGVLMRRPEAWSGAFAPDCYQHPTRSYPQGSPSPSWAPSPPDLWRPPFSSFPPQGGDAFFLLLLVVFGGRRVSLFFGRHVRSTLSAKATPGPFGRFLGLLLRHIIRCREQHLRQEWGFFVFG